MKILFALLLLILLISGCAYNREYPVVPCSFPQQTKESIYAQTKIGKTTNIEVLKFLQYPTFRYISDSGLIGYMYSFRKDVPLEKKSTGLTTEIQYVISTGKSCLFIFNKNGILKNIAYNENSLGYQTKYDLIKTPDNIDDDKFIQTFLNLKIGSSTGAIFRQIGKPHLVHEHGRTELWQYERNENEQIIQNMGIFSSLYDKEYMQRLHKRAEVDMRHQLPYTSIEFNIPGYATVLYLLELKNNKLSNKYIMKMDQMYTEEEGKALPRIEYKKFQKTNTETRENMNHD